MRTAATVLLLVAFAGAGAVIAEHPEVRLLLSQLGTSATVPPNEINTWAEQLSQRESELDDRERELTARERGDSSLTGILAAAVGLIGALLVLNYYLDWRRGRDRADDRVRTERIS